MFFRSDIKTRKVQFYCAFSSSLIAIIFTHTTNIASEKNNRCPNIPPIPLFCYIYDSRFLLVNIAFATLSMKIAKVRKSLVNFQFFGSWYLKFHISIYRILSCRRNNRQQFGILNKFIIVIENKILISPTKMLTFKEIYGTIITISNELSENLKLLQELCASRGPAEKYYPLHFRHSLILLTL